MPMYNNSHFALRSCITTLTHYNLVQEHPDGQARVTYGVLWNHGGRSHNYFVPWITFWLNLHKLNQRVAP